MKKILFIFILFLAFNKLNAQISIVDIKEIDDLKTSKLYVFMDNHQDGNLEYEEIFKKHWTLCPYEIADPGETFKLIKENCFYMTPNSNGSLVIWTPKTSLVKKINKSSGKKQNILLMETDVIIVAKIELQTDLTKPYNADRANDRDFLGKGYKQYWGPGILKNYLQLLQTRIRKQVFISPLKSYSIPEELITLKKSILYVPEELLKTNTNTGEKETTTFSENYPYKYEVVTMEKLNELIMNTDEPIYYLTSNYCAGYVFGTRNVGAIVKSDTGDIIYTDNKTVMSYYFPPKLVKKLAREIEKYTIAKSINK